MQGGTLTLTIGEETYELDAGDCIDFDVAQPLVYENRTAASVNYIVAIRRM